jgi:hypothetical protein
VTPYFLIRKRRNEKGGKPDLPDEVTQSNERVSEVRFIRDHCGTLIGTQIMLTKQVEKLKKTNMVYQKCKEAGLQ